MNKVVFLVSLVFLTSSRYVHGSFLIRWFKGYSRSRKFERLTNERRFDENELPREDMYLSSVSFYDEVERNLPVYHQACINGITPLHVVCHLKKGWRVQSLVDNGYDVNAQDDLGRTPLQLICEQYEPFTGDTAIKSLLENEADPTLRDNGGNTALHAAILKARVPSVLYKHQEYVYKHAFTKMHGEKNGSGKTWLHLLVGSELFSLSEKYEVLKSLEKHDIAIDLQDIEGNTLLHDIVISTLADEKPYSDLKELLELLKGSKNAFNHKKQTVVHACIEKNNYDLLEVLLEGLFDDADERTGLCNLKDRKGNAPLQYAVEKNFSEFVPLLMKFGAQVDIPDAQGETPLHTALLLGNNESIEQLLKCHASVVIMNCIGETPLHYACFTKKYRFIENCIARGASVKLATKSGKTLLHLVCHDPQAYNIAAKLLKAGADCNAQDSDGITPLMVTVKSGNRAVWNLLLQQPGLNMNVHDSSYIQGNIAHWAIACNRLTMLKDVVAHNSHLMFLRTSNRWNAFHIACHYCLKDIACYLYEEMSSREPQRELVRNNSSSSTLGGPKFMLVAYNNEGYTPLHYLICAESTSVRRTFIRQRNDLLRYLLDQFIHENGYLEILARMPEKESCKTLYERALDKDDQKMETILISYGMDILMNHSNDLDLDVVRDLTESDENNSKFGNDVERPRFDNRDMYPNVTGSDDESPSDIYDSVSTQSMFEAIAISRESYQDRVSSYQSSFTSQMDQVSDLLSQ